MYLGLNSKLKLAFPNHKDIALLIQTLKKTLIEFLTYGEGNFMVYQK